MALPALSVTENVGINGRAPDQYPSGRGWNQVAIQIFWRQMRNNMKLEPHNGRFSIVLCLRGICRVLLVLYARQPSGSGDQGRISIFNLTRPDNTLGRC